MGSSEIVEWTLTPNGLVIKQPKRIPNDLAIGYKISLYDEAEVGIGGEDPGDDGN
ncbi:hypothetical protein [Catenovulum agarivorans]|uniref:hypothetical protein n=1 Tax=Catenovulum agarivorans TaxID=1172192 RepID=UPI0004BC225C|nr:hypothetical protein [Catenovulum agarivorans]